MWMRIERKSVSKRQLHQIIFAEKCAEVCLPIWTPFAICDTSLCIRYCTILWYFTLNLVLKNCILESASTWILWDKNFTVRGFTWRSVNIYIYNMVCYNLHFVPNLFQYLLFFLLYFNIRNKSSSCCLCRIVTNAGILDLAFAPKHAVYI